VECSYATITSPHGHDAFLLEPEQVGAGIVGLLEEVGAHG
jgi:homoserine acetyltransferase